MPISRLRARGIALSVALAALVMTLPTALASAPASAAPGDEQVVTLVNRDSAGGPVVRFDVNGEAIDAHDGQIQRFGDLYYLYGTSYGCGFRWQTPSAPFCGFVSYSSPDLVNWTPGGTLFDATGAVWQERCNGGTYGCFRPHVVFNETTREYVLWINTYDSVVGYRVFTSASPTGPFVETAEPVLAAPAGAPKGVNYGDHQVFVDDDGIAYLAFTDWLSGGDILVERLDASYTTGSGEWTRVNLRATEAPTIFKRGDVYYLTYSDPNRGYTTTGTGFVTAPTPLGPWTGTASTANDSWTVADDALEIVGGDVGLTRDGAGWSDYTFTATVTPELAASGTYAQVGLVVGASAGSSYQFLIGNYPYPGAESGNLTKIIPGRAVTTTPLDIDITIGTPYVVSLTISGTTIETRIDGQLVDTTTTAAAPTGKVGFRESGSDREKATIDDVSVTASDGTVLFADDFSADLAQWDRPSPRITGTNITTTSCGGQPTDVLPLQTASGTLYLYQSDVWLDAEGNQAPAKHYWQPLAFSADGAIEPIECGARYDVSIPVTAPLALPTDAAITTGDDDFRTYVDVGRGVTRAQTFTVEEPGVMTAARFTTYQRNSPNAPLTLELHRLDADGAVAEVVGSTTIAPASLSWAAKWASIDVGDLAVSAGDRFAIVAASDTTAGKYGFAYRDSEPLSGGQALYSRDSGQTWSVEANRVLHIEVDIRAAVVPDDNPPTVPDPTTPPTQSGSDGSTPAGTGVGAGTQLASTGYEGSIAGLVGAAALILGFIVLALGRRHRADR